MAIKELEFKNHEEWLAIRSQYIGGSDAAAVLNMNPYKSRYTLWAEKTGQVPAFTGNVTTKVGAFLEDLVAKMFEEETGKKVRRKNFTMVNDLYPFACANVDRMVVGEKAFLEIKTTNSPMICKQLRGSEFPEAYLCQVTHYLAVTGLEKAYLAVLSESKNFKIYELERDEEEIAALMRAEEEFWNYVLTNAEPATDGLESTTDTLKALYPTATEEKIDLSMLKFKLDEYTSISAQIKELTTLKDSVTNAIKSYMQDAGYGICDGYTVTYKNQKSNSFDKKKFAADHADINLDEYYGQSRVLRITAKKEK